MIRLIAFFVLAAFVVIPCAHANEAVSEEVAAKIALEKEPGEITKTVITKTKTELVYDFTIKSLGRGMVEVEIDGHNGAITGHKVLKIDAYKDLPDPLVLEGDAKAIAIKHVQENAPGTDKIFNGADDDASGSVAVLEMARVLSDSTAISQGTPAASRAAWTPWRKMQLCS